MTTVLDRPTVPPMVTRHQEPGPSRFAVAAIGELVNDDRRCRQCGIRDDERPHRRIYQAAGQPPSRTSTGPSLSTTICASQSTPARPESMLLASGEDTRPGPQRGESGIADVWTPSS